MPSAIQPRLKLRKAPAQADEDPRHHLVLNRGFWWVCCSINATRHTKEKLSHSLRTKCFETARLRRDVFLHGLQAEGLEIRLRRHASIALGQLRPVSAARLAVPWKERVADVLALALATELEKADHPARPQSAHLLVAPL